MLLLFNFRAISYLTSQVLLSHLDGCNGLGNHDVDWMKKVSWFFFKEKKTWWTYPKNSNRVVLRDPIPSSGYVRIVQHFRQWESKRYTSIPASYLRRWSLSIVIDHPRSLNRDTFIWLLHAMCFVEDQLHLDSNGGNLRTAVVLTRQRNRKTSSSLEILLDWSIFTKIYTSPENYTVLPWNING